MELTSFEKDRNGSKSILNRELRYLKKMASMQFKEKISDPDDLYVWNFYTDFKLVLNRIKSRRQFADWGLTDAEIFAIHYYTSTGYKYFNSTLRENKAGIEVMELTRLIASGFSKLKKYKGVVWRVENIEPERASQMKVGDELAAAAFTSTSSTKGAFKNVKSHTFSIRSRNGRSISSRNSFQNS